MNAPLIINSYLHTLIPTTIVKCFSYQMKPNWCHVTPTLVHTTAGALQKTPERVFCLATACERSPCIFGNCSLSDESESEGFRCMCARGWKGKRCAERIRPCASKPCNHRGACLEKDGQFLCQCNPSWKGKRCEIPNPTPHIIGLGARMMQEPFWLGLFAVFLVLGMVGLIWCAKRHFPEKIEKLLAEEADRCARRKYYELCLY
ncbi:unnamed protein product [Leptidea sinapis]|uniref:EGF-like domain-containing protein n=1 Tax=Leptidea sinapis TaxID=189913 RepID=A0A5E4QLC2_9NEOP|nr:unnamed protein product [Leptidea sinapis]